MSFNLVYYVHGITTDNENNIAAGWIPGELSENGIKLAKEASQITRTLKYDAIFCSDLNRTRQTAGILFNLETTPIFYDDRLRECNYGQQNGAPKSAVIYADHIEKEFPEGESLKDVENRVAGLLNEISSVYADKTIAVLSHRAPQLALEVIVNDRCWIQAIDSDWRTSGKWQLGWEYSIGNKITEKKNEI